MLARTLSCVSALVCLLGGLSTGAEPLQKAPGLLRAGTALVDITPTKFPVIVNGGFLEGSARGVVDPLHARALVLANDQTTIAIVVVDSCMLPRELLDRAKDLASKATGIPTDKMLISATHTHTAPSAMGALGSRPDPDYPEFLIPLLARAIETAHQKLQPAQLGWGVIDDYEHTFNRRWIYRADKMLVDPFGEKSVRAMMNPGHLNPDVVGPSGPVDPGLTVVGIKTRAGKPLAVLANYSMHYYGSPALSADYYGRFCAKMRQAIVGDDKNDDFLAIMSQGTSGDLNATDTTKPAGKRDIDAFAQGIADNAMKVYNKLEYRTEIPLAMSESLLKLKRRVPDEKRLAWAKEKIAAMGDRRPKDKSEVYALEAVFLHEEPERELKLQAMKLGDLAVTAMPNEVFALTGLKLKKQIPFQGTMNISLANGSEGYIPPYEQNALGGYTTWPARTAALVPEAEKAIIENLKKQVHAFPRLARLSNVPEVPRYVEQIRESKPWCYWRLEQSDGNRIYDSHWYLSEATLEQGFALYLDGPQGEQFSGKDINRAIHFVGGRLHAEKNLGANYSVEFWFWNGLPHDARPVTAYLFSRGDPSDKEANGDHLGIGGTHRGAGKLIFFNGNTQQELLVGQTELKLKHWHHVVLVREGTRITVYLDGNPEPDISGSAKVTYAKDEKNLFFAGRSDKFALLEGKLDEISLYDRALPTEEVMKHARAAGLEPPPAKQSRALSPHESHKSLHLPPGLRAELVTCEPHIESPVAMAFDERGRLWVVEMIDYPNGPKPGEPGQSRIKLLTDNDGNGRFENARVFADKLLFANGLIPYRDGVIVTAAPEILWLRDTDDDGVCDQREVLYKGFATGNPQLRVSHPILLPDGRICVVNGLRGGKIVRGGDNPGEPIDISGRDFAFDPRTGKAEAITGMGQYGNTLDDAGNRFVCTNRNHWIHIGLDEKYLRRNPWMSVPPRVGDNQGAGGAARIFPLTHQVTTANEHQGTFTAACGVHVYRGIGLPQEYRGAIFTCDPTANLVHHEILVPHGSTFIGKPGLNGQEFLASTDPWFRPVFLAGGPDGALYVVDMYRRVIEHPEWLPPSLRGSPDFDEGKERGRIWRVVANEIPKHEESSRYENLAQLPLLAKNPGNLMELLYHPDAWWQTTAQRLLLEVDLVGPYNHWLRSPSMVKRSASGTILCAYILRQKERAEGVDPISALQYSSSSTLKLHTLRIEEARIQQLQAHFQAFLAPPAVACQFAASLGYWDDDRILPPLAAILDEYNEDPQVRLAVLSSVATRSGQLVERLLRDQSTFRVVLTPSKLLVLCDLASIVAARRDPEELALLLDAVFAVEGNSARRIQLAVRRGLIDGATRRGEQLPAVLARLPITKKSLADKVTNLADESLSIASDATKPTPERLAAIAECAQLDWAKVRPVLNELLPAKNDPRVRVAAVRALATFNKPEVAPALVAAWDQSPEYQAAALEALLAQPDRTLALLAALESHAVDPRAIDAARQALLTHRRSDIRERAAVIFAAVPTVERQAVVQEYQAALKLAGDARRGQELFRGKATCAQCHRVGDVGHAVGPNLSELRTKTPAMLLNDILDPNGAIDANFVNYSVTLTSGKTVTGIIVAESANSLTLRRAENQTDTISRADIEPDGLVNTRRSLMPEGIEKTLNVQELADVIAYLQKWRELP